MASIQFYKGFTALRTSTLQETAELIVHYADKIDRNYGKGEKINFPPCNQETRENTADSDQPAETIGSYSRFVKKVKKDNITTENINEIMLCQIPDVSSQTASVIMKEFKTILNLIESLKLNSAILDQFCCLDKNGKSRKIGKNVVENIKRYLLDGA